VASPELDAAGRRPMTVEDQFRLAEPGTPLISPDGQWVLYTVERSSLADNARRTSMWLAPATGAAPPREFLREGDSSPMWAPGSRSVYFLRSVGEGDARGRELFEQGVSEAAAVQRSRIGPGPGGSWQISRDGRSFLVLRSEAKATGPAADSDVVFVDEGSNGQTRDYWRNLWRYDLGTQALTRLTQREWWINSADLAPDARSAVVAARPDNGRNTRARTELFLVDFGSGAVRQLTTNGAPEGSPQFSPDGRHVLFSAVRLDRWELGNGDLWQLDLASGATRNLTPGHSGRFGAAVFSPDGRRLLVQSGYGTTRFPVEIDVASGRVRPLMQTDGIVRVGSWSADRRTFAYVYTDFTTPPDVYVARAGNTADRQHRVSDLNPWVREEIALGSVQRVQWPSFDGKSIEGLLHLPPQAEEAGQGPRPLIVHVACGPGCAWLNQFSPKAHVYAGLGYAQLSPNVRGASNYDDPHMRGNLHDVGGGDRLDIMSGVDAMIARGIADPDRLGIDGWSYGAILAGYTITQTPRFKAASLGAMVSDWVAEFGASAYYDLELWFLGGTPWTNGAHWRDRSSLTHADKVKTPTLLHHGDEDDTCSPVQSMNFFTALRRHGTVARLLRYPGEPHDFQQPVHLRLRDAEDVAWMQRFVRGVKEPGAHDTPPPVPVAPAVTEPRP
jgi:dipeptidyl aminopeptidase/acylaminoacyl peptidase